MVLQTKGKERNSDDEGKERSSDDEPPPRPLYNTSHVRPASCSDDGAISGAYSMDLYHRPNEAQHDDRANRRPPFNSASTSESRMGSSWLGSTAARHKPKTTVVYLIRDTGDKKLEATQNTSSTPPHRLQTATRRRGLSKTNTGTTPLQRKSSRLIN